MQIQPITNQPNYKGKLVFEKETTREIASNATEELTRQYKKISAMVKDKSYDIFISRNRQNPNFYNVSANKTLNEALKVKEYTVKVQVGAMPTSFVDAAKDAMEMYEKYIAKGIKR